MTFKTGPDDSNRRLDRILRKAMPDSPLSFIHRLLRQGQVLVDGKKARPFDRVPQGALLTVPGDASLCTLKPPLPASNNVQTSIASSPPLEILWQGSGLLAVCKPAGLEVHGPNSLDTQVRHYLASKIGGAHLGGGECSLSFRPGPLHRLDKPTSGAIVFSTSLAGAQFFSKLLQEGKVRKTYLAIVEGRLEKEEIWQDKIARDTAAKKTIVAKDLQSEPDGKMAITRVMPLAFSIGAEKNNYSLVMAEIRTGKTHQIRAQAAAHNHPLAGDVKYGGHSDGTPSGKGRLGGNFFLHAWKLEIEQGVKITAPLPQAFLKKTQMLFGTFLNF